MTTHQFESYLDENTFASGLLSSEPVAHSFDPTSLLYDKLNVAEEGEGPDDIELLKSESITEKMWTREYIGLYAHYAGVGINGGIQGLILNFCVYYFHGAPTLCPNAQAIIFLPWSFKIFFAIFTDSFRPFGLRRKPYLIAGWMGVLLFTLILAIFAPEIGSSTWILLSICTMFFLMVADVPADGYSVELGKLEKPEVRGQILATGQRIRFVSTMIAGFIQAFLVNGPTTNPATCPVSSMECWSWGLTVGQYYLLIFIIIFILFIPILYLQEPDASHIPMRTFEQHWFELWETLENRTAFSLLIYVTGTGIFSSMGNVATTYVQYYVIGLTNLQAGVGTVATYFAVVVAIGLFQAYLINRNWRTTQYMSTCFTGFLGLQWLLVFYDIGGLRNGWFTIFITLNQAFSSGITQVLFAMAVIELAKPGQEAITYEMVVSVANAAGTLNTIVATQLLQATGAAVCNSSPCPSHAVDVTSESAFIQSNGPDKFRNYTFLILGINLTGMLIFTRFLPKQKDQCHEWRIKGERSGTSKIIGYCSMTIAVACISYGILCSIMLVNVKTSCMKAFGGSGCQ